MREADWQKQVMQLARMYGWRVAHFGNTVKFVAEKSGGHRTVGDRSAKGFPDLVLVRNGRLMFAELKTDKTYPSPDQRQWMEALSGTGTEVYLWRPRDLPQVAEILK